MDTTLGIIAIFLAIFQLSLLVLAQSKYMKIIKRLKNREDTSNPDFRGSYDPEIKGQWITRSYWLRTPFPIDIRTDNVELNNLIKSHNQFIWVFWLSSLIVIIIVLMQLFQ